MPKLTHLLLLTIQEDQYAKAFQGIKSNSLYIFDFGSMEPCCCTRNVVLYVLTRYKLCCIGNHRAIVAHCLNFVIKTLDVSPNSIQEYNELFHYQLFIKNYWAIVLIG
jgi:hypothetical protein